jgi:hypothetical protein
MIVAVPRKAIQSLRPLDFTTAFGRAEGFARGWYSPGYRSGLQPWALVGLFEGVEGSGAGLVVVMDRKAAVAGEGGEVIVTFRSVAFEAARQPGDREGAYPTHRDEAAMNGAPKVW